MDRSDTAKEPSEAGQEPSESAGSRSPRQEPDDGKPALEVNDPGTLEQRGKEDSAILPGSTQSSKVLGASWAPGMLLKEVKKKVDEKLKDPGVKASSVFGTSPKGTEGTSPPSALPFYANNQLYTKAMDFKNKNRDESRKKTLEQHLIFDPAIDPSPPSIAQITISSVALRDLPARARRSPYVVISVEGKAKASPRAPSKQPNNLPAWAESWNVSDVWSDVAVYLYAAKVGSELVGVEDEYISKGFLPLSHLLSGATINDLFRDVFMKKETLLEKRIEVKLLPFPRTAKIFAQAVAGIPSTGITRSAEPTGTVEFVITIKMNTPLGMALMRSPPMRKPIVSADEQLNPIIMQQRKIRLKTIMRRYADTLEIIAEDLLSWKNPFATSVWLTLFTQVTLLSEPYNIPFMMCLITVFGAYFAHNQKRQRENAACPAIYDDETPHDPDIPHSLPGKVRALQMLASGVQRLLGSAALVLERIYYALSWDDPVLSMIVSCGLLLFGFLMSMMLMFLYQYAIVLRISAFVVGITMHFPGDNRHIIIGDIRNMVEKLASIPVRLEKAISTSRTPQAETMEELLSNDNSEPVINQNFVQLTAASQTLRNSNDWRGMLRNVFDRVPDALEMDHRTIAKSRISKI